MFKQFLTGKEGNSEQAAAPQQAPQLTDWDSAYGPAPEMGDPGSAEGRQMNASGEGTDGSQTGDPGRMSEILERMERMEKQLRDRDSHISRIEGENKALATLITSGQGGVGQPAQAEADTPFVDEDTKALLAKQMQENPGEAVAALTEYAYAKARKESQAELAKLQTQLEADKSQQKLQQQFLQQLSDAARDFGEDAQQLIVEMTGSTNPQNTTLGAVLAADPSLAQSKTGVYQAVGNLVLRSQQARSDSSPAAKAQISQPNVPGVPGVAASNRSVGQEERQGPSVEDQIGQAILNAKGGGSDDRLRNLFS